MRSIVASHWKLTMKNWEQWSKLILLLLHKKLPKNSMSTILWLFSIWSKLERWTTLISGCLMSWPKIFKKSSFWSVVFSYSMQQQQTISWWDFDMMKSEFYMTTDNDQPVVGPRISSNALPKNKLAPKKSSSLFGGLLWIWSIRIPVKPYIWEVCSTNRWAAPKIATPTAGTGQ